MTEEYTIGELEKKIGYQFRDKSLLKQALTHSSFANEQRINKLKDYERLEFLGDAVLELISSDFLFHENPQMPEGKLTKLRSSMVCEPALAYCARDIERTLHVAWKRRGGDRWTQPRFDYLGRDGGSDRRTVIGRRF